MNELQSQGNTNVLELTAQAGASKAGELFVDRALNGLLDGIKNKFGEARVLMSSAFTRYLNNATQRYNQVKTLATGTTPRSIIGDGNIYVSIGVKHKKKRINTDTVDALLRLSKNILISGTGGIGKSMMMRYLFLNTANRGEYIPVLLELRKISNLGTGEISILDLIYSCMKEFDVDLPREQFEYSLRLGKYLFLMDGFDEVKEEHAAKTASAIQSFCSKYPENPCIITSRPRRNTSPLETFTVVESLPLTKDQAIQLASKIWEADEKTTEFCKQLEDDLYDNHKDFAENPLLLSMMFLTFMRNNSVPNHLAEFYNKAYDALYSAHDSNNKGFYRREFRCARLDETSFKLLLSHFCFKTYFKEDYEFSKEQLLLYLDSSISKLALINVRAADYLEDLCNAVCMLVEEGDVYRFSHRSFQSYFAAYYTSSVLTDEQQKKLFETLLSNGMHYVTHWGFYKILSQIEPQRFAINALEDRLRVLRHESSLDPDPNLFLLKKYLNAIDATERDKANGTYCISPGVSLQDRLDYNIIDLFVINVVRKQYNDPQKDRRSLLRIIYSCLDKVRLKNNEAPFILIPLTAIDSSNKIDDTERKAFYDAFMCDHHLDGIYEKIDDWLVSIDRQREKLSSDNFLDSL